MKQIREFEKLFKLNIPVAEHAQYYIDTLSKSDEFDWINDRLEEFKGLCDFVSSLGYEDVKSYKMKFAVPTMTNFIKDTEAYKKMQEASLPKDFVRTKDNLRGHDGETLLSIDFNAANYNTVKSFDEKGEMCDTWDKLCESLIIHPFLAKSKSFRQYVFGNTNPNRLQRIQHLRILSIVDELIKLNLVSEEDLVFISHDEIIIKLSSNNEEASTQAISYDRLVKKIISDKDIRMSTHFKVFRNDGIGRGMCVQTIYNVKLTGLSEDYKTLFKVPGNKFFKLFKQFILEEPLDKRDLMFMNDGEVAVWAEDSDSIVETIAPDGELTFSEIESDYPYLLSEIRSELPSLSNSQIRKVINIFLDTCNSCHNAPSGCYCWNDD